MNAARLWAFGSILVIGALLLGTWFVGVSPRLDEASAANESRATVVAQNTIHSARLVSLEEQFEKLDELRAELEQLRVAIPEGANLPDLISQVNRLASRSGVAVTTMTFADAIPYAPIEDPSQDPQLLAAAESVSPESFFALPLQLAVSGTYADAMAFVRSLQAGERLFLVHDLTLSSGVMSNESVVDLSISGQVFALLNAADVAAAAAATAETAPTTTETAPAEDTAAVE
ncbi:MAG: type 4a pilus biogenesis protein PilO [Homoserinimonas sp.]